MEVGITELRADLKTWIEKARSGDEIVITDRGRPVARLAGINSQSRIERLVAEGVVTRASRPRVSATGRPRIEATGSVSDLIER